MPIKFTAANHIDLSKMLSWFDPSELIIKVDGEVTRKLELDLPVRGAQVTITNINNENNYPYIVFNGINGEGYGKNLLSVDAVFPLMRESSLGQPVTNFGGEGAHGKDGYGCFAFCSSLGSLPTFLFRYNPQIVYMGGYGGDDGSTGYGCFYGCSYLRELPVGLLDLPLLESVGGFGSKGDGYGCFAFCTNLREIPAYLFNNAPNLISVGGNAGDAGDGYGCFYGCNNIEHISHKLFKDNTKLTSIGGDSTEHAVGHGFIDECPHIAKYADINNTEVRKYLGLPIND